MRTATAVLAAVTLAAQAPEFGVESRLVVVPVMVTDGKGRSVESLQPSDFALFDEGQQQRFVVDTFATGVAPIALVVAVQTSGISAPALAKVRRIGAMIQASVTGDRGCAGLVSFAGSVQWMQDCTSDAAAFSGAFDCLQTGDERSARMLDAIQAAVQRLRERRKVRRVVLLISQSRDRGSQASLESVLQAAQAAGVTVYAATYSTLKTAFTQKPSEQGSPPPPGPEDLPWWAKKPPSPCRAEQVDPEPPPGTHVSLAGLEELVRLAKTKTSAVLAQQTGGNTFSFARLKSLEDAIARLGEELHSEYVLSFTPEEASPGFHRLEVRVRREDVRVRARPGYWSMAMAGSSTAATPSR